MIRFMSIGLWLELLGRICLLLLDHLVIKSSTVFKESPAVKILPMVLLIRASVILAPKIFLDILFLCRFTCNFRRKTVNMMTIVNKHVFSANSVHQKHIK